MRKFILTSALACTSLALTSCETPEGGGALGIVLFDKNQHVSGAGALFPPDEEACLTASFLLSALSTSTKDDGESVVCQRLRYRLQHALGFHDLFGSSKASEAYDEKLRRNEAIGALIAASNDKCGQSSRTKRPSIRK